MQIGRKTAVENMREIWPTEPRFSDWLVTDEGLALIADEIGIQIENPRRESRPGDFPCDVVGNLQGEESHIVVIENQFGRTDHDHLGKLLTYAAMHSAMTGIWIAERASDDHRKVVDWLNDNTPPSVSLYLVELGAIRIGDSPVAPELRVVSRPNFQAKNVAAVNNVEIKELHIWRKAFWQEICASLKNSNAPFPLPQEETSEYIRIRFGKANMGMLLALLPITKRVQCRFWIEGRDKATYFDQLRLQRVSIEAAIGEALNWQERPEKNSGFIALDAPIDPKIPANREKVVQWFAEKAIPFFTAFNGPIQQLARTLPSDASEDNNTEADSGIEEPEPFSSN